MMRNELLIEARVQRGWTQEDAAEKIGVSRVAYARWEEQGIRPRLWSITEACKVFNRSPEQLGFKKHASEHAANTPSFLTPPPTRATVIVETGPSVSLLEVGILALTSARQHYGWTFDELLKHTEQEMRRIDAMTQPGQEKKSLSRRDMIALLMSTTASAFGVTPTLDAPLLHDDEIVSLCAVNIPLAWRLYFAGGLAEVRQVLPSHLAMLTKLAQQPTRYQQRAAGLAAQGHQLGYLVALQDQNFRVAQTYVKQALHYAELADDPNLRASSLIRQGNLFYTLKQPLQTMQKYQDAVQYSSTASSLIVGQAYVGLAEAYARIGQKQEALRFQGLAQETFPHHPENDLHFAYTHFNHFTRTNFEGLMHLHLDQPQEAWSTFAQIDEVTPTAIVPQRVELLSRQALTLVALQDLDQSCTYIERTVTAAQQLGSDLRYNEACETYLQMQALWPHEKRVKELADLFRQT